MAILSNAGNTYSSGDAVTAANLNAQITGATFEAGDGEAADGTTLQVHPTLGYLKIKDGGVDTTQLAAGAVTGGDIGANEITSTNISSTDGQFLVDGASTQKTVVINEAGEDVDFRVEGDNDANLIVTDGANDVVGIGGADTSYKLNVEGNVGVGGDINISKDSTSTEESIKITNNHASAPGESRLQFSAPNASTSVTDGIYGYQPNPGQLSMTISDGAGGWKSMAFNSSGNLAVPGTATANGVVLTSDQTLKQDIDTLNDAEKAVATRLKGLVRKFRFIEEVEKDADAKTHVGVNAQEVQQAFADEGLNSDDYAVVETSGDKLGVRYNELFAFVIAAL